jgi:hypothetical protein
MSAFFKSSISVLALILGLTLAGCSGKGEDKKTGDDRKESDSKKDDGKPRSFITAENFDRIQAGMTKPDVAQILGGFGKPAALGTEGLTGDILMWEDGDKVIFVSFGLDMKVMNKKQKGLN